MGIETLYDNEWVSLRQIRHPESAINGYVYSHESRCAGRIVSVLPYRRTGTSEAVEVLLRDEITPCWHTVEPQLSTITGGWEPHDDLECRETARRELYEEAGYAASIDELINLGACRGTKSTDTMYWLWGVDLTGREKTGTGEGDGSEIERAASCRWVSPEELIGQAVDPLAHVLWTRLDWSWLKIAPKLRR